jgi:HEPN domain-containing protein
LDVFCCGAKEPWGKTRGMTTVLNQWVNCALNLSTSEIERPLEVIYDFFSADDLAGHFEDLKKWRDRVIDAGYYTDLKGSPSGLIMRHQLTVRLVECASVLLRLLATEKLASLQANYDKLENEKEFALLKNILNETEIKNPYLILKSFFQEYDLAWYREQLTEWFESALCIKPAKKFVEAVDLVIVYEQLQKLYAASWIWQFVKDTMVTEIESDRKSGSVDVQLYSLEREILPIHQQILPDLVAVITKKLPTTTAIYYLGNKPRHWDSLFLFILTADHEEREALSLGTMLEESCMPSKVIVMVHYASSVLNAVNKGDYFFSHALSCPPLFNSGRFIFPVQGSIQITMPDLKEANWERWKTQSKEFLSGAEYYLSMKAYSAALFSLHQCAECILIAIIRSVAGYKINNHNLLRLLKLSQLFTFDLMKIFQLQRQEEYRNFITLKDAYINVRYRDSYEPDASTVDLLYLSVTDLYFKAEQVHMKFLLKNTL